METNGSGVVVFVTAGTAEEAEKIGKIIVESRLAACASILNSIRSIFRWENDINVENECLMIIKTTLARYPELEAVIRRHHSYTTPEIIALPVIAGAAPYLEWIRSETHK